MAASTAGRRAAIALLRNDLRIHDNPVLLEAAAEGTRDVIPLFCFDPRTYANARVTQLPRMGVHRARFLLESVADLRARLRSRGSDLLIREGHPEKVVPEIVNALHGRVDEVIIQREVTSEETAVEYHLARTAGVPLRRLWGANTLIHAEDVLVLLENNIKQLPSTYTGFRKLVESSRVRPRQCVDSEAVAFGSIPSSLTPGEPPSLRTLAQTAAPDAGIDLRSTLQYRGGETAAMERIDEYFWKKSLAKSYKVTRNGLLGGDFSSKFSPWLSIGCLSPRMIYKHIHQYEKQVVANDSTYWLWFELLWRDYFRYHCMKYGTAVFHLEGTHGNGRVQWDRDVQKFQRWCDGTTGVPFVDANMRELRLTGFMSNRGRQNVASFLVNDLGLDWRMGAEWFESMLNDYDVCSNWGNWQYAAGVGVDPRPNRYFHQLKQASMYDKDGLYVKTWLPELAQFSPDEVHQPHRVELWRQDDVEMRSGEVKREAYGSRSESPPS